MKIFEDGIFKLGLFLFMVGLMFFIPNKNFVFVMVFGAILCTYRIHKISSDKIIKIGVVLGFVGMTLWSIANLYFEVNGYYLVKEYWQIHRPIVMLSTFISVLGWGTVRFRGFFLGEEKWASGLYFLPVFLILDIVTGRFIFTLPAIAGLATAFLITFFADESHR